MKEKPDEVTLEFLQSYGAVTNPKFEIKNHPEYESEIDTYLKEALEATKKEEA